MAILSLCSSTAYTSVDPAPSGGVLVLATSAPPGVRV